MLHPKLSKLPPKLPPAPPKLPAEATSPPQELDPEALLPLFDKQIEGFGELFRQLSHADIGTSTIQSRAVGGLANGTLVFSLPGSSGAVTLGWEKILHNQLDINFRPCNFAELIPRFLER